MKEKILKNKERIYKWGGRAALAFVFCLLCAFYYYNMWDILNSDISTQLVLSELLNEEKSILSTNWYYATELRLLGYNIFFTPLFSIFSDWNVIRTVGSSIMVLTLELSLFYFCKQLKISRYFLLLGILFLIPFSEYYFLMVIIYTNYIPFHAISFVSIGLVFHIYRIQDNRKRAVLLIILATLSLLAGIGGMRQLFITYAPLLLASGVFLLLQKKEGKISSIGNFKHWEYFRFMIAVWAAFLSNGIGYLINSKYLAYKYSFANYESLKWSAFSISKLGAIIGGIFQSLGFTSDELIGIDALRCAISFVLVALVIYAFGKSIRARHEVSFESTILALFMVSALLVSVFVFCFTTMSYDARYDVLWVVMAFPLLISYFSERISVEAWKKPVLIAVIVGILVCSTEMFHEYVKKDTTSELRNIAAVLEENGYQQGYATFWNANVMTELSNGYLEVWDWGDFSGDFTNIDQTYAWAQLKSHDTEHPTGKVFWILTETQETNFHFTNNLGEGHVLYRTPDEVNYDVLDSEKLKTKYVVYVFNSYEEMYALTANFSSWKVDTMYPGTYTVICYDAGLGDSMKDYTVSCWYNELVDYKKTQVVNQRPVYLELQNLDQQSGCITFTVTIEEKVKNFQIEFKDAEGEKQYASSYAIIKDGVWYADFYDNKNLTNGYDELGTRHLAAGGSCSFGPYVSLPAGTYTVDCDGTNLDSISCDFTLLSGAVPVEITNMVQESNHIYYEVTLSEYSTAVEARFWNNSDVEVTLSNLRIQKIN